MFRLSRFQKYFNIISWYDRDTVICMIGVQSYQWFDRIQSYQWFDRIQSYQWFDRIQSYQWYDRIQSYQWFDRDTVISMV